MKIKKFNNLWTMGLIIFGAILVAFYLAKLIFPEFVVELAQIESVVKFGEFVDTHKWAYYLFTFLVSFITYYFYCGACCRKNRLSFIDFGLIAFSMILLFVIEAFLPNYYFGANMVIMIVLPTIICRIDKKEGIKYLYSTALTFGVYSIAQILSLEIRGISTLIAFRKMVSKVFPY